MLVTVKFITIGDVGVGKSSIISRFDKDEFSEEHFNTIGISFVSKTLKI